MDEIYQELLQTFVSESLDFLDEVEPLLIHIAEGKGGIEGQSEQMNVVFRLFHTIKGNAQAFKLDNVSRLAHHSEGMLSEVRAGTLKLGRAEADVLCRIADLLRRIVAAVGAGEGDGGFAAEADAALAELAAVHTPSDALKAPGMDFVDGICWVEEAPASPGPSSAQAAGESMSSMAASTEMRTLFLQEGGEALDTVERSILASLEMTDGEQRKSSVSEAFRAMHSLKGNCGFMGFGDLGEFCHRVESTLELLKTTLGDSYRARAEAVLSAVDAIRRALRMLSEGEEPVIEGRARIEARLAEVSSAPKPEARPAARADAKADAGRNTVKVTRSDVRVDLRKLDSLVDLVGELVIAEAMVMGNPALRTATDEGLDRASHQLRRVILELQDVTMSVRMVPVAQAFQKMVRIVHDVCLKTGKKARLEMRGEDTEVDRTLVERISDPLVHAIRNAIDHGIEPPEERLARGKDETGLVLLEAGNDSGEVWIRISDDGRGLDTARILKRAVERGLVREDQAPTMGESQIHELIFEPGFSTAETLTDVSGRGVGMDVVRKNISDLKGRVRLQSRKDLGMTVSFHIPLTLAVIDGMLVRVGNAKYTIPLLTIQESLRPEEKQITRGPDGTEYVRIRAELIPVIRLHELYGLVPDQAELTEGICVVVDAQDKKLALFVDAVLGQQQTVIKALPEQFVRTRTVSGCTILGTGEVSLIVDVPGVSASVRQKYESMTGGRA